MILTWGHPEIKLDPLAARKSKKSTNKSILSKSVGYQKLRIHKESRIVHVIYMT